MGSPEVRLFVDDELIRSLPFEADRLRIGRRPENDLVIEDLAVSRMHAVLVREADGSVVLEDAGSGNGSYLDGERIEGRASIPAGRPVRMGRHVLVWVDVDGAAEGPEAGASGSATPAGMQGADADAATPTPSFGEAAATDAPARGEASLFDFALEEELGSDGAISDDGVSFDELAPLPAEDSDELLAPDTEPPLEEEIPDRPLPPVAVDEDPEESTPKDRPLPPVAEDRPLPPVSDEEIPLPAIELDAGAVQVTPVPADPAAADAPDPLVRPEEPAMYAGLVVQHRGALLRVVAWDADRMCIGRGDDCEVLLDDTGVSRRHALLVRDGSCHEVRDLESINGTEVNGESVRRRVLEAGDVIRIEEFQLTFLLDHSPIADEVQVEKAESRVARGEAEGPLDLTLIREITDPGNEASAESESGEPEVEPAYQELEEPTVAIQLPDGMAAPGSESAIEAELDGSEADLFTEEEGNPLLENSLEDEPPADLFAADPAPDVDADVEATVVAPELAAPPEPEEPEAAPLPTLDVLDEAGPLGAVNAPVLDALDAPLDEEAKEDAEPPQLTTLVVAEPESAESSGSSVIHQGLSFEIRLAQDELPEALARVLEEAEGEELRIPLELRIRRSSEAEDG